MFIEANGRYVSSIYIVTDQGPRPVQSFNIAKEISSLAEWEGCHNGRYYPAISSYCN
jgi:hypothetical protein